jgi:hypothetical protein
LFRFLSGVFQQIPGQSTSVEIDGAGQVTGPAIATGRADSMHGGLPRVAKRFQDGREVSFLGGRGCPQGLGHRPQPKVRKRPSLGEHFGLCGD